MSATSPSPETIGATPELTNSPSSLPTLTHHTLEHPCPPCSVVVVTHILDTAIPFLETIGDAVSIEAVVGIPYSTMPTARRHLEANGLRVVLPSNITELPRATEEEIRRSYRHANRPVIVQEIGGYCAPLIRNLTDEGVVSGVVEDTKQGHWRYAELADLPCPVLSIADSPLKALENQQVGRSISHALETILRRNFHRLLTETRIGVLGYGGIGEATARALSSLGARVLVHDTCGIRMAKAALDGFGDMPREQIIHTSDVLLGVSGHRSIERSDLIGAPSGSILASGSSKQIEIDLDALHDLAHLVADRGTAQEFAFNDGRVVHLLNDGMPINFLEQSILGRVLDLVYTELYMCIREIALGEASRGLHELTIDQHREIARAWRGLHWV